MSSLLTIDARITMTIEDFATGEAEVVATTDADQQICQKVPIEGVRERYPAGETTSVIATKAQLARA